MNVCHRHPSMTKKFQIFGGVSRRAGRAWGGRMGWERVHAPRRGRRGYFARGDVVEPTSGPSGCGWDNGRGQVGAGGRMVGADVGAGGTMVGADVPGGPPPARGVRQPSRAWTWGAGGRAGRAPLPMSGPLCVRANVGGPCGRHAPRVARVLRAPGRGWEDVDLAVGGEDVAPCGARPRQARPSRVVEGVGDAGFHVGTVPPGRYAARRRAKYPRRPRRGTSKRARRRARPRQARPSRVAEV